MSEALVSQLARALNLPPDAARHTLDHLVATLREQIDASGQARVPGLGTFVRDEDGLSFRPDDTLARAVNHRYAGLRPISAGSSAQETEPEDPFAKAAPSGSEPAVGFQPLDSLVEPEAEPEDEPEAESEPASEVLPPAEETAPDATDASEEDGLEEDTYEEAAFISEPAAEDVLDETAHDESVRNEPFSVDDSFEADEPEDAFGDEAVLGDEDVFEDETAEEEIAAYGAAIDADPAEAGEEPVAVNATDEASPIETAFEDDAALEDDTEDDTEVEAYAEPDQPSVNEDYTDAEAVRTEDDDLEPDVDDEYVSPEAEHSDDEDEHDALGSLEDLSSPTGHPSETDVEDDEAAITAILPVMAGSADSSAEAPPPVEAESSVPSESADVSSDARLPEPPAAPAVAATSREPKSRPPATSSPRRGAPVAPIMIGVAVVLGIAALLWFLNRTPDGPDLAERPTPADTTTVAAVPPPPADPPADTAAAPVEPPEPAESAAAADPLRSTGGIDPATGGFSWVVGSELSRQPAERRVAELRAQGLRAGVIAEEAAGRTRYRVALGQFESIEQAERFRSDLPAGVPDDTWLLRL